MDRIADSIIRVKNAQMAKHDHVQILPNKVVEKMFQILKDLGYLEGIETLEDGNKKFLNVFLKYDKNGHPVITEFKRVSKFSCRVYKGKKELPRIINGYGTVIVSTSKGVMTGKEAKEKEIGGEIIAYIV